MDVLPSSIRPPASAATCCSARWWRPGRRPTGCAASRPASGMPDVTVARSTRSTAAACGRPRSTCVLPGGRTGASGRAGAAASDQHGRHAHHARRARPPRAQRHHPRAPPPRRRADRHGRAAPRSPAWVRERAVRAFRLLGEAEGRVHGVPAEQVALHEVGAVDALIDIVGGHRGVRAPGHRRGSATDPSASATAGCKAAHGVIPVPAPATAILLEGIEVGPNGPVSGEAVTPTGAVLLRVLSEGAPPARWRPVVGGAWGAGGRNPRDVPERAPAHPRRAGGRGGRGGGALDRPGRPEPRVSRSAARGARERPARWMCRCGPRR